MTWIGNGLISTAKPVGAALCPQDEAFGDSASGYSQALQREMVWLSGHVPYEQAQAIAERIGGWHVAVGTWWQQTQVHGPRLLEATEEAQPQVSLETTQGDNPRYAPQAGKAVSMDGGMVHVRGEGWKELKVGRVADMPVGNFANDEHIRLSHLRYCGVLGDVAAFEPALPYAGVVVVTADGAAWIWRLADHYFPCAAQVVDWYPACQHLAEAAQARFPNAPQAAQRWTDDLKAHLFKGEIHLIREQFNRYALADYGDYFADHGRRMQYAQFRAAGFPIGSGGLESGVKQFKQPLSGPGMRWSRPALQRMIVVRSPVLGDVFDHLWVAA